MEAQAQAQFRWSPCSSHTRNMKVDMGSDQGSDICPHLVAVRARLGSEFTEDKKCRSLVGWLICDVGTQDYSFRSCLKL